MATKDAFTAEEWQILEYAMTDTMAYLSVIDPGFWDSFKEAGHAGRFVANQSTDAPNLLVRDLAHGLRPKRDETLTATAGSVESPTLWRVSEAAALVAQKAPEDVAAFKAFILGIADAVAEASGGISAVEAGAIAKITEALGE
jgi:hypothetical protein